MMSNNPVKRSPWRPTKLTPTVQQPIIQVIKGGNYRQVAAQWAGVTPETLSRWISPFKVAT